MSYRADEGLNFLGTLSSQELDDLVRILTHDKDGEARWTETLTVKDKYKRYYPDHKMYWEDIAEEIQLFGGNTLANIMRGFSGVKYREILCDVCDKMKVNYNKHLKIEHIEEDLLMYILRKALDEMSPEDMKKLGNELGLDNLSIDLSSQAFLGIFQAIFKAGGFKSYQLTLIIVNAVMKTLTGKGLKLAANATLTRSMAILTGPIAWAVTGLWTLVDIAGTAYRVTIPAVIQIAYLRKLSDNRAAIAQIEHNL